MGTVTFNDKYTGESSSQQSCDGCNATGLAIEECSQCNAEWCYSCIKEHNLPVMTNLPYVGGKPFPKRLSKCPSCQ